MNVSHLFNVRVSDVHLNFEEVLLIGQQLGQHELRLLVLVHQEEPVLGGDGRRGPVFGIWMAPEIRIESSLAGKSTKIFEKPGNQVNFSHLGL